MPKNIFDNFLTPGPRGKLRWAVFGILVLFLFVFIIDISGFANPLARGIDSGLSKTPIINEAKFWPKIVVSQVDNSKSLKWRSIKDIDLQDYGYNFKLGLDLQGGAHLIYQADVSQIEANERADALAGVRDVIERRVNAFGVSEPVVQTNKTGDDWRIIVELAGVSDINQAIEMIGETPLLEFKEENPQATQLTPDQQTELNEQNAQIKSQAQEILNRVLAGNDFAELAQEYSDDLGSKDNGGLYQDVIKGTFVPEYEEVVFDKLNEGEIYPELVESIFGYHIIKKEEEKQVDGVEAVDTRHILFKIKTAQDIGVAVESEWKNTDLGGRQLTKATVQFDQTSGIPSVALEFDKEGTDLFASITRRNVNKPVAIFLDGEPISIPRVNEPILNGKAVISGNFSLKEAKLLAQRLNAGALPVPIELISQTTVGASLGNTSVEKSLQAGIIGLILVGLFMILYYRLPGLVAVVALAIYTAIVLAIFKLIPVTLTLAGIAGFILSVGMAVDANVLIFERMKEELRFGRSLSSAIKEGFIRAWSSIRDSNISTLITCAILFWFGSSIIKGFALTLGIGVIVSMFSAVVISRKFMLLVAKWRIAKVGWLFGIKSKKSENI